MEKYVQYIDKMLVIMMLLMMNSGREFVPIFRKQKRIREIELEKITQKIIFGFNPRIPNAN